MTKRSLWDRLNSEVNIDNIKGLITGDDQNGGQRPGGLDNQVEQILEFASQEAKRRGKPLEDVLDELGFDIGSFTGAGGSLPSSSSSPAVRQPTRVAIPSPSASSTSNSKSSRPSRSSTQIDDAEEAVDELIDVLDPLEAHEVEVFLEAMEEDGGVVERLLCLDASHRTRVQNALGDKEEDSFGHALLKHGIPPEDMAAVMSAEPYFPPTKGDEDFKEYILENEIIRYRDVNKTSRQAKKKKVPFLKLALDSELLTGETYSKALMSFTGIGQAKIPSRRVAKSVIADFPVEWVRDFGLVPLRKAKTGYTVVSSYVPSERLLEALEEITETKVKLELAPVDKVEKLQEKHLGFYEDEVGSTAPVAVAAPASIGTPFKRNAPLKPLSLPQFSVSSAVELVGELFGGAIEMRATDIHIEPFNEGSRVRYRIDGICHDVLHMNLNLYNEVIARIKVLADMDITERRRPQDGQIQTTTNDMRVATVPAKGGEKVSLRLANTGTLNMDLDDLGLDQDLMNTLREVASKPFGMVLATGPVGSGKTTTLYSCLNEVDRSRRHVMSIEDPVEINLEGANQVEVNYALGFDFVRGLRALLRQDPDTILIGEIRDEETARIAVRASMTGLMVFSTLHANESTGAVTTLRNFNIPSFLIANSLKGVVAQRLLRRICENCKKPHKINPSDARVIGIESFPKGFKAWRGEGCEACLNSGYLGRVGVFEIFPVDGHVRDMIQEEASERQIRSYAVSQGMRTLQQDGLNKINEGITTLEEFHRVLRY